jgi:hypothetical protein
MLPAASLPAVAATMRRYLDQLACVLRPGSVGGADLALRSLAAFLAEQPDVHSVADIGRRHAEDHIRWLAARPGRRGACIAPAAIASPADLEPAQTLAFRPYSESLARATASSTSATG